MIGIMSDVYPFVVNLYAITLEDNPKMMISPFLDWMTGSQGQEIVEKTGCIPVKPN